jgi:hypothetical protein
MTATNDEQVKVPADKAEEFRAAMELAAERSQALVERSQAMEDAAEERALAEVRDYLDRHADDDVGVQADDDQADDDAWGL